MKRSPQWFAWLLAFSMVSNLLAGCGAQPTPMPSPAPSATATQPPTPTEAAAPTWDGSADLSLWQPGADYALETKDGVLVVRAKKRSPTAFIEASFAPMDIRQAPYASLTALSDISANIAVGLTDAEGKEGWLLGNAANRELAHGTHPMVHSFDFSKLTIDLSQVTSMRIALNRGSPNCQAKVLISSILLGGRAVQTLAYAPLPDVQVTLGDAPLPVPLYPLGKADAGADWRAEFPTDLIQTGSVRGDQFIYTLTGKPGRGTVVLNGEKAGRTVSLAFDLQTAENQPPTFDSPGTQLLAAGGSLDLRLTGLDDGDPAASQKLDLTVKSENAAVVSAAVSQANPLNRWADLKLTAAAAGSTRVTLTLSDERGASAGQSFDVMVYPELNQPPSFELPASLVIPAGGELRQPITAISGGEPGDQVTLAAASDNPGLAASIEGDVLVLQAAQNAAGNPAAGNLAADALVTITASDNGGNERNQGNASTQQTLPVTILQPAITGLVDSFDGAALSPALANSGEGAHTLTLEQGALRVDIDKYATNNPWAGLWYALPNELDLSANPVITLRMKADRETAMLIFLWDANNVYNTAGTVTVLVGTEWKDYTLDFTGKNLDSEGKTVDFSRIQSLLINFAPGLLYKGSFWLDDLKAGSETGILAAPPALTIESPTQLTLMPGAAISEVLPVSGMRPEDQAELAGADPNYFSVAALSRDGDNLVLNLKAAPDAAGFTRLKLTVSGADNRRVEKSLDVIFAKRSDAAAITIDRAARYQTIDGFGTFLGTGVWREDKQALALPFVQDLGITVARFGIIDVDFEPRNDNANPYAADYSAFNLSALPLDWMRTLKAQTGIDKYILTVWSPPAWMKKNRSQAATPTSGDNFLEERYDEEYAEYLTAVVRVIEEHTGIELYAVSLQNEPQFNEPYASGLLPADKMAQLLQVVSARFRAEGIQTRLFMPEALPQQKGIEEYIRQLDLLSGASQGTDIIAIHNYDADGINVGGAGAKDWASLAQWANAARPRQVWMTETSGHPNNWSGAKLLFGNIYNALVYGNASAWVWWTLAETTNNAEYGLVVDNQATSRYAISRHFYRAAQVGAVRIGSSAEAGILSVAFENPDGTLAVVLYNPGSARIVACSNAGTLLNAWVSQDGLFSRPAQVDNETVLLPSESAATLIYRLP